MKGRFVVGVLLSGLLIAPAWANLQVQTYDDAHNDRFYVGNDKNFVGQGYDFSGVGNTTGLAGTGTWATMISPSFFVSAAHYHPSNGSSLTFFENNDPSGPSHSYTVQSGVGMTIDGTQLGLPSDLWLGKLTAPINPADNIATYSVLQLPNESDYLNLPIYVYGKPHRVGRNQISVIDHADEKNNANVVIKSTRVMVYEYNDPPPLLIGGDEAYLHGGDSGGPSFVSFGGQLALLGTHYFNSDQTNTDPTAVDGDYSGDSFIPYYISQLNSRMLQLDPNTTEQVSVVVPEPAGIVLIGLAGLLLANRRRVA
ncbi:MAG: PEP-CTERM sorting domain-containing protein [Phycisphaerales bacterium]|jgi:hypothetical protein|nr:PEP-CTERM sorting domain-containing protein [Phycisphaerales bacterium]